MNVLIDVNVILDLLVAEREFQSTSVQALQKLNQNNAELFVASSCVGNVISTLTTYLGSKNNAVLVFKDLLEKHQIHFLSVTGVDFSQIDNFTNFEEALMSSAAKRVDSNFTVLTQDANFDNQELTIMTYQEITQLEQTNQQIRQIPLLNLSREYHQMMEKIDHALLSVVASSKFIMGPEVVEFETKCAEYIGTQHAIGTSSGTEALVLALRSLAIQSKGEEFFEPADLIITSPFTFTSTGEAILRAGATPLFVDVEANGFNLDVNQLIELIKTEKMDPTRVVGILPVHLFGHPCNMTQILDLSQQYKWFVLEDVAQAFGTKWQRQTLGSLGTIGAFSFFPTKNLGGFGDGGLVTTDDNELAELVRMLLRHGGKDKYNVDHIGYNARLDTLQAAVLLVRLKYVDQFNQKRRQVAEIYNQAFSTNTNIITPQCCNICYDVSHQYTIRIKHGLRDQVQQKLQESGIDSAIYYPLPLHQMKVFKDRSENATQLSQAETRCQEVLSLPIDPLMTTTEIAHVVNTILLAL